MRMLRIHLVGYLFALLSAFGDAARILAIFPFPGPSQYILVQPYLKELAARGHNVSVISAFPQKEPIANFRDITMRNILSEHDGNMLSFVDEIMSKWQEFNFYEDFFTQVAVEVFETNAVQRLLHDPMEKFDLLIVETIGMESLYALGDHFNAPVIGVTSMGSDRHCDRLMGNTSPLSYIPMVTSDLTDRMSFTERLENVYHATMGWIFDRLIHIPQQQRIYEKYMPHKRGDFLAKSHNISLLLMNQHYALSFPRPYVPNMIQVAGFHVHHKPAPLPQEIQDFIGSYPQGIVYFSLGTNIKSKYLPPEMLKVLMDFFAELPYGVLWKFEDPHMAGKPSNVYISKWFPQPDILAHQQVKVFFTHGGLLSTIESLHHGKPVIGMPIFFDQFLNVRRAERLGFGVGLNFRHLTIGDLRQAFDRVLNESTYRRRAAELSKVFRDQPLPPMESAIYWTEYVLRHKGAPFMRVAGVDMHFIQYHSLDTFGVILVGLILFSYAAWKILGKLIGIWQRQRCIIKIGKKYD